MGLGPKMNNAGKGSPQLKALVIDLDDTLYRNEAIPEAVRNAIQEYMINNLGFTRDNVKEETLRFYLSHGTTLAGLVADGHKVDYDKWHDKVHHTAFDYNAQLKPDPDLREILCSIDLPKYILTNADQKHAEMCLDRLGIRDCFKGVFGFEWMMAESGKKGLLTQERPIMCKPVHQAYELVLDHIGYSPSEVMFFDDSARNIMAAHELGMTTALVGREGPVPGADMCLKDMHELPRLLPELIDQPGVVHDAHERSTAHAQGALQPVQA